MNVSRTKILCVEIYKTINKINPQFMNEVFNLKEKTESRSSQVEPGHICEKKSLKVFGPKIWNNLPYHIKLSQNLETFKSMIEKWNGSREYMQIFSL